MTTVPSKRCAFASRAECDAALPHILAAPRDAAAIDNLCFRPAYGKRCFPDQLHLTVAGGIADERWLKAPWLTLPDGSPDPRIQVSILPRRGMDLCWRDRGNTVHPGDTMRQRTQLINGIRGHLTEFGIVGPQRAHRVQLLVDVIRDENDGRLPGAARQALLYLVEQLEQVAKKLEAIDKELVLLARENETCRRLMIRNGKSKALG